MLKSVAMAMPVYAMSCFKLPLGIISEIESLLMNFWWEKTTNHRGIPWIAWKRLQYTKKEGGLGFRDLAKFNDALLAKQVWRIIHYPNSLFARVMKARYFKDVSILDSKASSYQSYGWASLLAGRDVIKKEADNVVATHPPRPLTLRVLESNATLEAVITTSGSYRYWNEMAMSELISPVDHKYLKSIYLSRIETPDRLIWNYTPSGEYTVRSGYWLLQHDPLDTQIKPPIPHGSVELKNKIWKLPLLPKIKYMLWRTISHALPTSTRLRTRGMTIDSTCSRCLLGDESINHVLFTCPYAARIWRLANVQAISGHSFSDDTEENISLLVDSFSCRNLTEEQRITPLWLIWRIWKARNKFVFENFRECPLRLVTQTEEEGKEWIQVRNNQHQQHVSSNTRPSSTYRKLWTKPQAPFLKCNFDVSFHTNNTHCFGGWIIRDTEGHAQVWGSSVLGYVNTPLEAETKALLVAMQQAWIRGYTRVHLEGDCEVLINTINGNTPRWDIANLLVDIDFWASKFSAVLFSFTPRQCNSIAHRLASSRVDLSIFQADFGNPPLWLQNSLCNDIKL
ncbi:putative ribonuclease H domain, reverse transcriptase zinc-binding domain-containing protein [Arabidopsis thaliana]